MDKPPSQDSDKFRSIFSDNLKPIATRGKKARGTLLFDQHCGNDCSIKLAPLSVSYYNEISGGHIGRGLFGGSVLPAQLYSYYFFYHITTPVNAALLFLVSFPCKKALLVSHHKATRHRYQ